VRAICGLDTVQSGDILVYGKPLKEHRINIPMVFQTYSNYEWMTVLENVMLPMKLQGIGKQKAKETAMELLSIVGLSEHADKYPHKLSGGQQQRVSIARSLACNSQIMVFDEATGALDIKMKREVQNVILKIFYDSPVDPTILNITHSIEEAAYISNHVVILQPNPCKVYKEIKIHYDGEETRKRGEWIFETNQYADYVREITQAMDAVCR
jgi:ABC-type nitrate/sulfonate/bicarbonate transport system ATPase subunit